MKKFVLFLSGLFVVCLPALAQLTLPVNWTGGSGGANTDVCGPNVITYTADPIPPGLTYKWYAYDYSTTCGFTYYHQLTLLNTGSPVLVTGITGIIQCIAVDSTGFIVWQSAEISMFNSDLNEGICSENVIGDTLSLCPNDSALLRVTDYAWNVSISVNPGSVQWQRNGIDIPGENNLRYYADTSGTYRVKFTLSCGVGYSNEITVDDNGGLNPVITGTNSFCDGESTQICVNVGGTGPFTYLWSIGSIGSCMTVSWPGTYTVTVTDMNGCSGTAIAVITVSPNPVPVITGGTNLCLGQTTTLDAGGGYSTYIWNNGVSAQTIVVWTPGTYTVIVTDANGCTGTDSIQVTGPEASILGSDSICTGATTSLNFFFSGNSPFIYSYTDGSTNFGPFTTNANSASINVSPTVNTTYSLLGFSDSNCAGNVSGSAQIIIIPDPVPIIAGDSTLCPGQITTLTASAGYSSYLWNNGNTTPTLITSTLGPHTVTVTDAYGCSGTNTITLIAAPPYSTVLSASGPIGICQGDSVQLTAQSPMNSYQWHKNNLPISGATSSTLWAKTTGWYKCLSTDSSNCPAVSNQLRVAVVCFPPLAPNDKEAQPISNHDLEFTIAPNPSDGNFTVMMQHEINEVIEIRLYDVTGNLVLHDKLFSKSTLIKIDTPVPGFYVLEMSSGSFTTTRKQIVIY